MRKILFSLIVSSVLCTFAFAETAPDFSAKDIFGKDHKLSDYKGKVVVLEWFNPGCPYVKKHYESGNMQKLQKKFTEKGVIWLNMNSSAEGKQGNMTSEEAQEKSKEWNIAATASLVDSDGVIGKKYGAKTTPHMFVINQKGELIYKGAIDDNDSASKSSVEGAKNYVDAALEETLAGKPVTVSSTTSYGCSVKY